MKLFEGIEDRLDLGSVRKNLGKINEIFIELGESLSDVKNRRLFKKAGYETFKEFIDQEYNMSMAIINKIIRVYKCFVVELDYDEETLKSIGFDKLVEVASVKSKVKDKQELEDLLAVAEEVSVTSLRSKVNKIKEIYKEENMTVEERVFEYLEDSLCASYNLSKKGLYDNMLIYLYGSTVEDIKEIIEEKKKALIEHIEKQCEEQE